MATARQATRPPTAPPPPATTTSGIRPGCVWLPAITSLQRQAQRRHGRWAGGATLEGGGGGGGDLVRTRRQVREAAASVADGVCEAPLPVPLPAAAPAASPPHSRWRCCGRWTWGRGSALRQSQPQRKVAQHLCQEAGNGAQVRCRMRRSAHEVPAGDLRCASCCSSLPRAALLYWKGAGTASAAATVSTRNNMNPAQP